MVMEEGVARVIFQQIFIEQLYLLGPGIDTVPALVGLGPDRGPAESLRVAGWGSGGAKGDKSFLSWGKEARRCEERAA